MTTLKGAGRLLVILFLFGWGYLPPVHASYTDAGTVHIGVLAKQGKEDCFEQWNPTADYLQQRLPGFKVQIVCLDFDEVDPAVRDKHVDFTITDPSMYVNLEYRFGASRISTLKNKRAHSSYTKFGGVIFFRADRTDIRTVADLKGKRVMAVADNSFGGWLVSWRYLLDHGIDPSRDFKELRFGGRNDTVVTAVEDGSVDAGCIRTDTLERMSWEQKIALKDFTVIDSQPITAEFDFLRTTRLYPEWPLAKARHTSQDMAKRVALAMMQMTPDSKAAKFSRSMGWTIPLDYHEVHECLRQLKFTPYADYGKITLGQLYQQYRIWLYVGIIFWVCIFTGVTLVLKLNRRLESTLANLDAEHRQRARVMADLNEFKLTLDQTLDCVFMFAADTLQFIYANQGALDLIGYNREELLSMTPLDIRHDASEAEFRALLSPLREETGTSITYTNTNRKKDGTLVPVEVFLQHVTPPQKKGRFVAIVRDITNRLEKEREREFLQTRLLQEQKLASVGQLAAGIAHEINTPAQYLGANIDFLDEVFDDLSRLVACLDQLLGAVKKQDVSPQLLKTVEDTIEEVDWSYLREEIPQAIKQSADGVKQVSSIVLAMKNFAHPGGTEKESTDLNELINTTLTVSRNEWKYYVEPVLHLDPQLPEVACVRNELGQVFLNIIVNAAHSIAEKIEAGPEGSKGLITISSAHQGDHVIITMTDTGCGISEENLVKIFDPFFTTKEVGKGTGQGLTIAYDIVTNKHGGTLEVTSKEGVGTTFTITLLVKPILPEEKEENLHE